MCKASVPLHIVITLCSVSVSRRVIDASARFLRPIQAPITSHNRNTEEETGGQASQNGAKITDDL